MFSESQTPRIRRSVRAIRRQVRKARFPGSHQYWETRYNGGGSSGAGSIGEIADFKAKVLNEFVGNHQISSVIEFGCGDGTQLARADYPCYVGLDVAKSAIDRCIRNFAGDTTKSFFLYDPVRFQDNGGHLSGDLALSLDVLYHLIEDETFWRYMHHLFEAAERYVIIFSTNFVPGRGYEAHVRHRRFTDFIESKFTDWALESVKTSPENLETMADFYVYGRLR